MRRYFPALEKLLKGNYEEQNLSIYRIMQLCNISQATATRLKENINMTIKEAKFLKKMGEEIEVQEPKLIPIVMYLLKDYNYFKNTSEIIEETNWSRYLIKQAKEEIELYIKENIHLKK